jgi:hypothetical protein
MDDDDFELSDYGDQHKRKKSKNTKPTSKTRGRGSKPTEAIVEKDETLLDQNKETIWGLIKLGIKASEIASLLNSKLRLKQGSISTKQVDNWISYRKNSGQGKTYSVSLEHNNLRADDRDCMFI